MPKKTLATILKERTETIEYRAIRKHLINTAQNGKNEYRIMRITDKTIVLLQNEGIHVEKITELGCSKFLLTWPL